MRQANSRNLKQSNNRNVNWKIRCFEEEFFLITQIITLFLVENCVSYKVYVSNIFWSQQTVRDFSLTFEFFFSLFELGKQHWSNVLVFFFIKDFII